jgi:hypothetical protein
MNPTPHAPGLGPQRGDRFHAPWGAIRRDGHRGVESALAELLPHLSITLLALPIGRREGQDHLAAIDPDAPDTPHTRFTAPAASWFVDRIDAQLRHVLATEVAGPQGLLCLAQGLRQGTHPAC